MQEVTIRLPKLPKGFEYTGEYRQVKYGDMYLNSMNKIYVRTDHTPTKTQFLLVRHIDMDTIDDEPVMTNSFVEYMLSQYLGSK